MDAHLSPAETTARFGVSIKALRLYEQRGLLMPQRTEAGWRVYGPVQFARLHQIIALKRLGLALSRIGEILGDADLLDPILELQERALSRDGQRISHALALVKAARAKLASGRVLSIDDLATLTQETVLNIKPSIEEIKSAFAPMVAKHFSPDESRKFAKGKNAHEAEMIALKSLVEQAMKNGDPASALARQAAERYRAVGVAISGGDSALLAKIRAFRKEALSDPKLSGLLFLSPEMQAFLDQAVSHMG